MVTDVYMYDSVPQKVRVQVIHLILDGLGQDERYGNNHNFWVWIVKTMRQEKGVFELAQSYQGLTDEYNNWLLTEPDVPSFLDGVELAFMAIKMLKGEYHSDDYDNLLAQLNARFAEGAVGYELRSDQIIRIDKQIIHQEVVIPALTLLHEERFAGANKEFLSAHEFYRNGNFESSLIECGKAFESVLKVIGAARGWAIQPNDTASKLIGAAFQSAFIPQYMQGQFTALRAVLESGVPAVRNRMSGHGAGGQVRKVDRHLAAYQLHQTAAAIVFLVDHDGSIR